MSDNYRYMLGITCAAHWIRNPDQLGADVFNQLQRERDLKAFDAGMLRCFNYNIERMIATATKKEGIR